MDNNGRLWQQVAAMAQVPPERAVAACYLANLAAAGKTLDEAATLMRKDRGAARDYARDWGIRFVDYVASDRPLCLTWTKAKRGRWELMLGDVLVASAVSDGKGTGGYEAVKNGEDLTFIGSCAEIAMRRLSLDLERRSVAIFGLDDVEINIAFDNGISQVAPELEPNALKLRSALAA